MATAAPRRLLDRLRTEPLRGTSLALAVLVVWVAGALYCSGYEALTSGFDNWPGSLIWSAAAILPWLTLFEWSKSRTGRRISAPMANLALLLVGTAAGSIALELATDLLAGAQSAPLLLLLLRRLPAIGVCLLLILWSRAARPTDEASAKADASLSDLAASIDWVAAADNYVELHIGGRVAMRRMTMREAERALKGHGFVRIHRRYLVSRDRIRAVHLNGRRAVALSSGEELPVGRSYEASLAGAR